MLELPYLILLSISDILIILVYRYIKKNQKSQLSKAFSFVLLCMFVWCTSLLLQILAINFTEISPIYIDYIVYIGICFLPVSLFFLALVFAKTKIKLENWYLLLFVIPILSLIILWTNDFHNLFYITYSINSTDAVFGPYFTIHTLYTYLLFAFSIFYLLRYSFKNSGVFSRQSSLIIIGSLVPIIVNIAGLFGIKMNIYITPISFTITILFFAFAIFRFGFTKVTPIALQKIVDRISDGYIVLDENNTMTDFNLTFLKMFHVNANYVRGKNIFDLIKEKKYFSVDKTILKNSITQVRNSDETFHFNKKLNNEEKYFNIEINSIKNNNTFIGTLILFKDTTQHILDMETIQNNQNMLMERERLASLGQLIGGIAHNLKTPIMSIAGAAEGLSDLVKEYESSVEDSDVTVQDHYDIAKDMKEWIEKVRSYTEYMSDVITAVKGQAVTMSDEQAVSFTLDELVKRVDILMRHELKNALISLNVSMQTDEHTILKGNINSLVQVINNMVSNAIQAYNGETNQKIDLILSQIDNTIVISIKDYAGGLPKEVQDKLFKEMITTKGKNGTGLGLFMSYSTIRAHFNGNITFDTEKGKGTTFNISLPM